MKPEQKKEAPPEPSSSFGEMVEIKVRRNALQVKEADKEAEKEIIEREKFWETPAFLRKK